MKVKFIAKPWETEIVVTAATNEQAIERALEYCPNYDAEDVLEVKGGK